MSGQPDVSIIVPTFREVDNLSELVGRIQLVTVAAGLAAEIVIVDDNSCDGTIELCTQLEKSFPVRLITRIDERGLSTAVIRGLQEARGEFLLVMDADLSHPPEAIRTLLMPLANDSADFVVGSRYVPGASVDERWTLWRHINSRAATLMAAGLTTVKDPMAGFFALKRATLIDTTLLNPCGYKIGLELIVRCGCRSVKEVPIRFEDRKAGESKLNIKEQLLYIQHLTRLYAFRYPAIPNAVARIHEAVHRGLKHFRRPVATASKRVSADCERAVELAIWNDGTQQAAPENLKVRTSGSSVSPTAETHRRTAA